MSCQLNNNGSKRGPISSIVRLSGDLMFNELLKHKHWNIPFSFFGKKPLARWHLSESSVEKIIDAIVMEEGASGIQGFPAGLTYLGQLITHDIVSDSEPDGWRATAQLNLDSLIPDFTRFNKYSMKDLLNDNGEILLGKKEIKNKDKLRGDLFDFKRERIGCGSKRIAKIPDQRNDENIIVSQMAMIFMRLHNLFVRDLVYKDKQRKGAMRDNYEIARAATSLVFQTIVVEEYLARILTRKAWEHYFKKEKKPFFSKSTKTKYRVPLEFSHAAFRFGHCMVRESYSLRKTDCEISTTKLFRRSMPLEEKDHQIDWDLFFPPAPKGKGDQDRRPLYDSQVVNINGFNNASPLGLHIAGALTEVPFRKKDRDMRFLERYELRKASVCSASNPSSAKRERFKHLVIGDLRASAKLPTGGDICRVLYNFSDDFDCIKSQSEILKIADFPTNKEAYDKKTDFSLHDHKLWRNVKVGLKRGCRFKEEGTLNIGNAPLWLFVLREAEEYPLEKTEPRPAYEESLNPHRFKLGPLGSTIVAEVIFSSIKSAAINIWDTDIEAKLLTASKLYEDIIEEPSMYKLITKVIALESKYEQKRHM
ncbi:hypothetical protein NBRC116583_02870 [Arenicella sp. 4NH20-0111]